MFENAQGERVKGVPFKKLPRITAGDRIDWQQDRQGHYRITAVQPRASLLARPDERGRGRPIAANLDRILLVLAQRPDFQEALVDHYLLVAESMDIPVELVLNKTDLLDTGQRESVEHRLQEFRDIGYRLHQVSVKSVDGMAELKAAMAGHSQVLVGQSGVGKSSLIRALIPAAEPEVGDINERLEQGRHTTSASTLYHLPDGGHLIDSPGVRDFGLWHIPVETIDRGFREFRPYLGHCRFRDCRHQGEPGCAVDEANRDGVISKRRLDGYRRILRECEDFSSP